MEGRIFSGGLNDRRGSRIEPVPCRCRGGGQKEIPFHPPHPPFLRPQTMMHNGYKLDNELLCVFC
jgi:hypothetical protein